MKKIFFALAIVVVALFVIGTGKVKYVSDIIESFTGSIGSVTDQIEFVSDIIEDFTDDSVAESTSEPTDDFVAESINEPTDDFVAESTSEPTDDFVAESINEPTNDFVVESINEPTNDFVVEQEGSIPVPAEYIIDGAALLTDKQVSKLEAKTAQIRENYNFDVVILTVPDLSGKTPQTYSMDFYINNRYNENGIIFLVSMAERDWGIYAFNYGLSVFSEEYGLDYVSNNVLSALSNGNYNKSFSKFLNYADAFLLEAESGNPYSTDNTFLEKNTIMLFSIIGALVIAIATLVFMAFSMNTKRPKDLAHEYVNRDSIQETERSDLFLYKTVTKTERQKKDSSDNNGGSSFSSGGRSGKF